MKISIASTYNDLLELKDEWENIFKKSGTGNIFASWEWCSLWWKHFGKQHELIVLIVKDGNETIGIAPMMISKGDCPAFSETVISFIGGDITDYMDFVICRDNKEAIKAILNFLVTFNKWGKVDLKRIPDSSSNLTLLKECISGLRQPSMFRESSINPFVEIDGTWDDYYKSMSKGMRQDIRTTLNKLKLVGEVNFVTYDADTYKEALDALFELHRMRQDYKLGQSLFDTQHSRDFFYDLAPAFIKSGWVDITALTINNRVISIAFALKYAGVFYYWIPAFDTEFIKYSLSKVHIQNLLKSCFEQNCREFDFMRGDEEYKFKWTNAVHKSYDVRIYRNNLYFNMDTLRAASRNYLKELYSKHPFVRKLMVKVSKSRLLPDKS